PRHYRPHQSGQIPVGRLGLWLSGEKWHSGEGREISLAEQAVGFAEKCAKSTAFIDVRDTVPYANQHCRA
ncbi:TPA: hypothetical protein PWW38_002534, partial [Mannheimia haemolytica]|nr:hypothetical protein [Mannheimia haemolytica]